MQTTHILAYQHYINLLTYSIYTDLRSSRTSTRLVKGLKSLCENNPDQHIITEIEYLD